MRALDDSALLALWERGAALHPLDRALVLCSAVRDDLPAGCLADLPLGEVNLALLQARRATFGPCLAARIDCERCAARLELALDADALCIGLEARGEDEDLGTSQLRALTMRDLAAIAGESDAETAARVLLERCCAIRDAPALCMDEVERRLEALDPAADIGLMVTCDACGHAWRASLDIGAFLWMEVDARAAMVLADVDRLARAYGWSEREILALSAQRRAAYLELCAR